MLMASMGRASSYNFLALQAVGVSHLKPFEFCIDYLGKHHFGVTQSENPYQGMHGWLAWSTKYACSVLST